MISKKSFSPRYLVEYDNSWSSDMKAFRITRYETKRYANLALRGSNAGFCRVTDLDGLRSEFSDDEIFNLSNHTVDFRRLFRPVNHNAIRCANIALLIARLLELRGSTAKEFSRMLDIDPSNFSNYLHGKAEFTLNRFVNVMNQLGVKVELNYNGNRMEL